MNLLCPNCQNRLAVSEQNAGQLMKCPFCNKYFSVPALPQAVAADASSAKPSQGVSQAVPAPPATASSPSSSAQPDTFALALEPAPQTLPPRPNEPIAVPSTPAVPKQPADQAPPPPPAGYDQTFSIGISPRVIRWVVPAALLL